MHTRPSLYGLLCDFCSSVREFARQHFFPADIRLPSNSTSRWTPLPSVNASYCRARCGLSPLSCCSCRAHTKRQQKLPCPCYRSSLHLSHDFLAHNILYPAANHLHPPHPSMPSARFPSSSHPHLPPQPSPEQAPQPALRTPSTRIPTASIARPHKSA